MPPTRESIPVDVLSVAGRPTRREWWTAVLIVCVGFALRAALPGRMAVEHFDEGVYASNLSFGAADPTPAYPDRHLYAPPLVPALLECALICSGGRPHAVMWVNVVTGALTVFILWWGTRRWFGPQAALVVAVLAATSDDHIAFSRMALTDVPLCLWMTAGVFAGWHALLSGRPLWIVSAAACAALAWWAKYNGWLTLAVTGSGAAAWLVFDRNRSVSALQVAGRWAAVATMAVLFWLPSLWTIPEGSSYADISANHARYFVGLAGWWNGLVQHAATLRYLDGWSTVTGITLSAGVAAWATCERFTWNGEIAGGSHRGWLAGLAAGLGAGVAAVALGSAAVLTVVAAGGVAVAGAKWIRARRSPPHATEAESSGAGLRRSGTGRVGAEEEGYRLAGWMVAAWFIGLLAATPMYHPYPRLALPWLTACWLAAAAVVGRILDRPVGDSLTTGAVRHWKVGVVGLIAALAAGPVAAWRGSPFVPARWTAWQYQTALASISTELLRDAARTAAEQGRSGHPKVDAVIYVYAEPGLFYQLESSHTETGFQFISSPTATVALRDPVEVSVFLVIGPHGERMGIHQDPAVQGYREVAVYHYRPSDLVALDEYSAARLAEKGGVPTERIRLYLVHGPLPPH